MPKASSAAQAKQHLRPFDPSDLETLAFGLRAIQDLARRANADDSDSVECLLWSIDQIAGKLEADAQQYAEFLLREDRQARRFADTLLRLQQLRHEGVIVVNPQAGQPAIDDASRFLDWVDQQAKGGAQ